MRCGRCRQNSRSRCTPECSDKSSRRYSDMQTNLSVCSDTGSVPLREIPACLRASRRVTGFAKEKGVHLTQSRGCATKRGEETRRGTFYSSKVAHVAKDSFLRPSRCHLFLGAEATRLELFAEAFDVGFEEIVGQFELAATVICVLKLLLEVGDFLAAVEAHSR